MVHPWVPGLDRFLPGRLERQLWGSQPAKLKMIVIRF